MQVLIICSTIATNDMGISHNPLLRKSNIIEYQKSFELERLVLFNAQKSFRGFTRETFFSHTCNVFVARENSFTNCFVQEVETKACG